MARITVVGLCHAHAEPLPSFSTFELSWIDDYARPLSIDGITQMLKSSQMLAGITFSEVFCSPAARAIKSAYLATEIARQNFTILPDLYTPFALAEEWQMMRHRLGLRSAAAYAAHPLNHCVEDAVGIVGRFTKEAGETLYAALIGCVTDTSLLVCSDAVYTPLAVLGLVDRTVGISEDVRAFLLNLVMAEAGAFEVTFDTESRGGQTFKVL